MLEKQLVGTDHLRTEPEIKKTTNFYKPQSNGGTQPGDAALPGFYAPDGESGSEDEDSRAESNTSEHDGEDSPQMSSEDAKVRITEDGGRGDGDSLTVFFRSMLGTRHQRGNLPLSTTGKILFLTYQSLICRWLTPTIFLHSVSGEILFLKSILFRKLIVPPSPF